MNLIFDNALEQRIKKPDAFAAKHPMFQYEHAAPRATTKSFLKAADQIFVLGMGGSLLPLQAWVAAAGAQDRFRFIESIDPDYLKRELRPSKGGRFCVVSKSGGTLEVQVMLQALLEINPEQDCLVVTDAQNSPLLTLAQEKSWPTEVIPSDIGGRFTNFTPFHQALLEELGFDYASLQDSARQQIQELKNKAQSLEAFFALSFAEQRDLVIWSYGDRVKHFAYWMQQVLAESLGKKNVNGFRVGTLPCVLEGPRDQHSVLQYLADGPQRYSLLFLEDQDIGARGAESKNLGTGLIDFKAKTTGQLMTVLAESQYRNFIERTNSPETYQSVGRWKLPTDSLKNFAACVAWLQAYIEYAGERLGINAFDQPGVERGKQIAKTLLQE